MSRAIDALIAEHLYGWIRYQVGGVEAYEVNGKRGIHPSLIPAYSTDIALAVGILEKLHRERDWWWTIAHRDTLCLKIVTDDGTTEITDHTGKPLPLAICLHVLHVLGVEVPNEP